MRAPCWVLKLRWWVPCAWRLTRGWPWWRRVWYAGKTWQVLAVDDSLRAKEQPMWTIRYNPHRIETTGPMYLGTTTWHYTTTWDGYWVTFTSWITA